MKNASLAKIVIAILVAIAFGYFLGGYNQKPATAQSAVAVQGGVRVIYSLDKKQNDRELISIIDNAKKYVYFAIYEFTLNDVADALVRAKERGVDVQGIMDKENSTTSYEKGVIEKMKSAGIPIETQTHPNGIMHIKALVTEKAYASGSYNWTSSATNINDEILEIGTDPKLRLAYENILKKVLANNSGNTALKNTGSPTTVSGTIDYTDAIKHIGQKATVSGIVVAVYTSRSGTTFFDYCVSYNDCPFSAVIFSGDKARFGLLTRYQGQRIKVSGIITSYKNRAEIVLNDPSQITTK